MTESMVERVEAAMTTYVEGSITAWREPTLWVIYKDRDVVFSCPDRLERDAQMRKMNARAAIEAMREPRETGGKAVTDRPSNEMVGRMARAMEEFASHPLLNLASLDGVLVGSLGDAWPHLACAAIEAMREPTDAMINAEFDDPAHRLPITADELCDIWRAMIAAALAEECG